MDYDKAERLLKRFIEQVRDEAGGAEATQTLHSILAYLYDSIPITLSLEARNNFEAEFPGYIRYWGTVEGDEILLTREGRRVPLPDDWINRGLRVLAARGYHRLGELLMGDYDADSLDSLVQAGVLGESRYG